MTKFGTVNRKFPKFNTIRASYHLVIHHVRKREEQIADDRFAEAIVWNKSRDFWNEIKRMKSSGVKCSGAIGGLSSTQDISSYFMSKYQDTTTSIRVCLTTTVYCVSLELRLISRLLLRDMTVIVFLVLMIYIN